MIKNIIKIGALSAVFSLFIYCMCFGATSSDRCSSVGSIAYRPSGACSTQSRTCCGNGCFSNWGSSCGASDNCTSNQCWNGSKCANKESTSRNCYGNVSYASSGTQTRTAICNNGSGWTYGSWSGTCVCSGSYTWNSSRGECVMECRGAYPATHGECGNKGIKVRNVECVNGQWVAGPWSECRGEYH